MKATSFLSFGLLALLTACQSDPLIGKWVEPIPGMETEIQGVQLEENGKASSINMHTLQYESWSKQGNQLLLTGKSIGNHQTLSFTDTLTIEQCTPDSLILRRGTYRIAYHNLP